MENLKTQTLKHLERLCVDIGPRPIGSQGNLAAAQYIQRVFEACDLEVEMQDYACTAWEDRDTHLELAGRSLDAAANAFSPACDVTAPTVALGTVAELEAAELTGCTGILYGDLTKAPLSAKSWFLISEREQHIIQLLEEKKPAALLTIQAGAGDLVRVIEDAEFVIPSATVPASVGLALLQQHQPTVRLRIDSQRAPGQTCNVVARKRGTSEARIVLCAHYDTKIDTPGANDNAAGVAVLLTLAQLLSQRKYTLGLEWIAFSGEEYLPMGDDEYVRRCGDQFGHIMAAINADGVGPYLGANSIAMMASSQPFQGKVAELTTRYPGVVWVDPWPQSNHSTFSFRGVPSIALSSVGAGKVEHLRTDTIERISPAKLGQVVSLVSDVVESLQDRSLDWCREPKVEQKETS